MAEQIAVLAGGCFWCTEAVFLDLVGVHGVESGYTGGDSANPTYREVCGGNTGHAEAIKISFDPALIGYPDLLDIFFATHDPSQLNRQGNDVGTQYRSTIFPQDDEQREQAEAKIAELRAAGQTIVTTIEPQGDWYTAEQDHQDYWNTQGPRNPYCMAIIPPKLAKLRKSFQNRLKSHATA